MKQILTQSKIITQKGVTLIELLIIVTIVGILASIANSSYNGYVETARVNTAITQISALSLLINDFTLENGEPPESLDQVTSSNLIDPWGQPYEYLKIDLDDTYSSINGVGDFNYPTETTTAATTMSCERNDGDNRRDDSRDDDNDSRDDDDNRDDDDSRDNDDNRDDDDSRDDDKGRDNDNGRENGDGENGGGGDGDGGSGDGDRGNGGDNGSNDGNGGGNGETGNQDDPNNGNDEDENSDNSDSARKNSNSELLNTDYDLYSKGRDGGSSASLSVSISQDDVLRANNGGYIGLASNF